MCETVVCTWGLHHLSLSSQPPSCSPCFNSTNVNSIISGSPHASKPINNIQNAPYYWTFFIRYTVCDGDHRWRLLLSFLSASFHPRSLVSFRRWAIFQNSMIKLICHCCVETAILCKRCKKWPLPYRWAEVPWTTVKHFCIKLERIILFTISMTRVHIPESDEKTFTAKARLGS